MIRALAGRVAQVVPTLLVVSLLAFALSAGLGDPVGALLGFEAGSELHAITGRALGLDRPLPERYLGFVAAALRGDLGTSWRAAQPVWTLLTARLPASAELAGCAGALALALGVPLGLAVALRPRSILAWCANAGALLVSAIPPFLLGLLLIQVFAVRVGVLPAFGRGAVVDLGGWTTGLLTDSGRRALVLPALTLGLFQGAVLLRVTRAEMARALASRPIRFARARGLPPQAVIGQALRLLRVPLVTVLTPLLGGLLAFGIVTETVFRWPGLGSLLIQSIGAADVPVVAACLLLAGTLFSLLSLVADALAMLFDPRLRPTLRPTPRPRR